MLNEKGCLSKHNQLLPTFGTAEARRESSSLPSASTSDIHICVELHGRKLEKVGFEQ